MRSSMQSSEQTRGVVPVLPTASKKKHVVGALANVRLGTYEDSQVNKKVAVHKQSYGESSRNRNPSAKQYSSAKYQDHNFFQPVVASNEFNDGRAERAGLRICVSFLIFTIVSGIGIGIVYGAFNGSHSSSRVNPNELSTSENTFDLQPRDNNSESTSIKNENVVTKTISNCGKLSNSLPSKFPAALNENISHIQGRIVGGINTQIDQHPWQVSVWRNQHICGGSIIAPNWILFAAHCLEGYNHAWVWTVYAGVTDARNMQRYAQKSSVTHIIAHSSFTTETFDSDIALLRLGKNLNFNKNVQPICLPLTTRTTNKETACKISGWGAKREGGQMPNILQYTPVEMIDSEICNGEEWLTGLVNERMFCAGTVDGSRDACQGDSGGPLTCYDSLESRFYLIGVVSWGIGCGEPKMPGVYTKISSFIQWVKTQVNTVEHMYL